MLRYNTHTILLILILTALSRIDAQDQGQFIYGAVYTEDDERYEGFMRWGTEEVAWHDIFNSTKTNGQMKRSTNGKSWTWGDIDWSIGSLWKDKYQGTNRTFATRFGDIAALHLKRRGKVDIELKNGAFIKVEGGSNDIGATIHMYDFELGLIKFDWERLERIEFFEAPATARPPYSGILYGTAKMRRGREITGYMKWDSDERVFEDVLDGESRNGDQSIPFGNITAIEKDGRGSTVTFRSGRSLFMDGSNDVDSGNRGLLIYEEGVGEVEVPWSEFISVSFEDVPDGPTYQEHIDPSPLNGEVYLFNGDRLEGQIIFDLDEMWDMEILDGNDDRITYKIPFRNIKSIRPKNRSYSLIRLHNEVELLLGDTQDVSANNDGVLIINKSSQKPHTIRWNDIDEIIFEK